MGRALYRTGHFCAAHPLLVLAGWLVLAVGVVAAMSAVGSMTSNDLTLPGTQSQQASDLLQAEFWPQQNGARRALNKGHCRSASAGNVFDPLG